MKVCFINTNKAWGGGEKWHLEMACQLSLKGYEVSFLTHPDSILNTRLTQAAIITKHVKTGNLGFLNLLRICRIRKILDKLRPDIVIINLPSDLKVAGRAARKAGVKKIIYRRGSAIPIKNTCLNRIIFRKYTDYILANSEETKKTILENNPKLIDPKKIKIIYNGIDLKEYPATMPTDRFDKASGKIILGNLARFSFQKGHDKLIGVAEILKNKGLDFHLYLAGDGELLENIQSMVSDKRLEDHVTFLGFTEDTVSFLNKIDILLMTSIWEGFGYAIAEAMACFKPVVGFDISSNPELIRNNTNGMLVEPFDINSFAERVIELSGNVSLRKEMGTHGRKMVEERFSLNSVVVEFEKFISEI